MIIYGSIILSFLITLGFYIFNKRQYKWWEFFVAPAVTAIVVLIIKLVLDNSVIQCKEIWGSSIVSIYEEEPWNEWVHRTCTRTVTVGKTTTTQTYDCSYQDDNAPKWYAETDLKEIVSISDKQYDSLLIQFGNSKQVVKSRKNYSANSRAVGSRDTKFEDKRVGKISYVYKTNWNGLDTTRKAVFSSHSYKNKIKASDLSVFNISLVNKRRADTLQLFNYPKIVDQLNFPTILSKDSISIKTQEKFKRLNGKFGPLNEVRLWVLIFEDKPDLIAKYQENYWVRGNMNELVICIGKKDTVFQWCDVFSWTTNESLKIEIRDYISKLEVINQKTWDDLYVYLDSNLNRFTRRDFHEFDYLRKKDKPWEIILTYFLGIAASIGSNFWSSTNEFKDEKNKKHKLKYN